MAESSEDHSDGILAGFLFGNIDESGNLETDILDEESKNQLSQLANLGVLQGIGDIGTGSDDIQGSSQDYSTKSLDSVDYSTIDELAEETPHDFTIPRPISLPGPSITSQDSDDDYDMESDDEEASSSSSSQKPNIPLPSIVPKAETLEVDSQQNVHDLFSPSSPKEMDEEVAAKSDDNAESNDTQSIISQDEQDDEEDKPEEKPPLTGLAALEGKTVTDLFPEFRPGKVLRFSRLFGPKKYVSAQWKGLKKKKRKRKLLGLDNTPKPGGGFELRFGPRPKPEDIMPDEAIAHVQPIPLWAYGDQYKYFDASKTDSNDQKENENMLGEWLFGPAHYWYSKHDNLIEGDKFNYGFKEKTEEQKEIDKVDKLNIEMPPDDHFNLVCLKHWEDDIIWSSDNYKPKENSFALRSRAGWIPSGNIRTMSAYLEQYAKKGNFSTEALISSNMLKNFENSTTPILNKDPNNHRLSDWYSLFPVENSELIYGRWEDKIIWDSEAVEKIPSPEIFRLDPNDENLILGLPEDTRESHNGDQMNKKEYRYKSRFMNKKNQENSDQEETLVKKQPKDMYNLSNDEFYMPKQDLAENQLQADLSSLCIQHSTPALELQRPFFPTYIQATELRSMHRPRLDKKSIGNKVGLQVIHSLYKRIKKKSKEREKERQAFGGGEMFFMRQAEDLSCMDGEIVLMEYAEELPPLLSQAGMNTRIRNYYKRKHGKDLNAPALEYGEVSFVQHSPFLGQLAHGQTLQALENNLYRAPTYQHRLLSSDFMLLKTSHGWYVRNVKDIFTVGQLCPKYEVPGPNSKRANNHIRDFLQIFIYRLFCKSAANPRRIKMEDIRKAFPKHSESSVRKRLKLCADFRRTGADCNWWVLKADFRLPSEEEMRAMVTPEQTCAYFMMLAAEQRLKDAGYGEKSLFAPDDDDNEIDAKKIDDEIQTAPWNTTRAYIQAMRGKCLLQVTGIADPTGCGEGFSYIRIPNKPVTGKDESEEQKQAKKQKLVTGTDADLRRLNLKQARILLKEFGVSQVEIEKLSRWEVIDKVRTMSTEAAKQGTTEVAMNKFARGSRFTVAEHQERYKDECQRIFDLQNKVLSSDAILSTDEESSGEEGSDLEDLGKDLESMLSNKKISNEEHEEAERRELQKLLSQDKNDKDIRPSSSASNSYNLSDKNKNDPEESNPALFEHHVGRRLVIHRTFKEGGREFVRTETVKNQFVIDAYLRIVTREKNYREVFASQDEKHKEDMRRERRRIQEQLRRIKRNEERDRLRQLQQSINDGETAVQPSPEDQIKMEALSDKPTKTLKCGACGSYGHMKTNKMCPKYTETSYLESGDELNTDDMSHLAQDDLIKVEGTKITLGKALLEAHQDMKRKSLTIRIPKENVIPLVTPQKKKRRPPSATQTQADYLVRHHKSKKRRRTNPVVALNVVLEQVASKLKEIPDSWPFHAPVSIKVVPDYYNFVKHPMDLQTIRENIKKCVYRTRDDFMEHVSLIYSNCILYNGTHHPLTKVAENMVELGSKELKLNEKELTEIEREINPLLDGDPQVGLSWIFEGILSDLKALPESWPFHQPVPVKVVADYYDVIKHPVDIETLKQRCQEHAYHSREGFLSDIQLLYSNSLTYNGTEHAFTKTARKMVNKCEELVKQQEEKLSHLEQDILNQLDDDVASTNPPSISAMSDILEDGNESYNYDQETFHNLPQADKQVITASNEDEFVDIEGEENMMVYDTTYSQQQTTDGYYSEQAENGDQYVDFSQQQEGGEQYVEYQEGVYGGEYATQESFDELYTSEYGVDSSQPSQLEDESSEQMDLGLLLLQDLVHSDEDDDDSDEDIPLDDGDDDIPLDDEEDEEFEQEEDDDEKNKTRDSEAEDDVMIKEESEDEIDIENG